MNRVPYLPSLSLRIPVSHRRFSLASRRGIRVSLWGGTARPSPERTKVSSSSTRPKNYPQHSEIAAPLNYAYYYFLEALRRCRARLAQPTHL